MSVPSTKVDSGAQSLSELFWEGQRLHEKLCGESCCLPPAETEAIGFKGRDVLTAVMQRVTSLALFSPNEDLEDVSTVDLKYVLVPFYLGEIYLKLPAMEKRLEHVQMGLVGGLFTARAAHVLTSQTLF